MKRKWSKHPIGATWEGSNNSGQIGTIWLSEIDNYGNEIWRWSVRYPDGSGNKFDYGFSYASCKKYMTHMNRMKRIK